MAKRGPSPAVASTATGASDPELGTLATGAATGEDQYFLAELLKVIPDNLEPYVPAYNPTPLQDLGASCLVPPATESTRTVRAESDLATGGQTAPPPTPLATATTGPLREGPTMVEAIQTAAPTIVDALNRQTQQFVLMRSSLHSVLQRLATAHDSSSDTDDENTGTHEEELRVRVGEEETFEDPDWPWELVEEERRREDKEMARILKSQDADADGEKTKKTKDQREGRQEDQDRDLRQTATGRAKKSGQQYEGN